MTDRNTDPGIGKTAGSGVMHTPHASRARTRTRGMSYGDINNIPLVVIPRACAHAREENAKPLACSLRMTRRLRKARAEAKYCSQSMRAPATAFQSLKIFHASYASHTSHLPMAKRETHTAKRKAMPERPPLLTKPRRARL